MNGNAARFLLSDGIAGGGIAYFQKKRDITGEQFSQGEKFTMKNYSYSISPHLWFDKQASEAAEFYCSLFPESKVTSVTTIRNTPSGDSEIVSFELTGQPFMAISAGPLFKFNPSISFIVGCETVAEVDHLWDRLSEGGMALMELDKYPFSERYGWVQDKYGLSWQIILTNPEGDERPRIVPALLFVGDKYGRAEEAINFYLSVFKDSEQGALMRYGAEQTPDQENTIMFADFRLGNSWIAAMDSGYEHGFTFNEAISFMVYCNNQEEIDYYWERLSAVPEAEQCGWLKDKFSVSWQVVPAALDEMMSKGTPEQIDRVTQAFLPMKKFDLSKLQKAFNGA